MSGRALTSEHDLNGLIQDIIDNTPSVIYVKDLSFRYLLINQQFEKLFGITRQQILGKTDYECFPRDLADGFRRNDVLVAERAEPLQCEEIAPHDDGLHSYLSLKFPLFDDSGKVEAVAGISTDITERLTSRREMESLKHRYESILRSVSDGICGLDAQGKIVFLNAAAERMLGWTIDELKDECLLRIIVLPATGLRGPQECPVAAVLRGEVGHRITDARFRCRDGRMIPVEYEACPMIEDNRIVGAVVTFHDLTDRIASLRVEQELRAAHKVQQALYPQNIPSLVSLDVAGVSLPSRLACGDYYDFLPTGDQSLFVAVGDVTGHGLGPALEMVGTRASLRAIASGESDLGICLSRLNQIMSDDLPEGMFITMLLARFDPLGRSLLYASGGHEGLIVRTTGEQLRLKSTGPALGFIDKASFSVSAPIALNPGDVILFPTDGLTETMSPSQELFGWNRAAQVIDALRDQPARRILQALCSTAQQFGEGGTHHDDVTAVVVRVME